MGGYITHSRVTFTNGRLLAVFSSQPFSLPVVFVFAFDVREVAEVLQEVALVVVVRLAVVVRVVVGVLVVEGAALDDLKVAGAEDLILLLIS
jgi:hypothetical protein